MYGPDSYLYATNLSLLATLSDEELADPALIAQLTPGTTALTSLGRALADAIWQGLVALGEACAPAAYPAEQSEAAWLYLPLY